MIAVLLPSLQNRQSGKDIRTLTETPTHHSREWAILALETDQGFSDQRNKVGVASVEGNLKAVHLGFQLR